MTFSSLYLQVKIWFQNRRARERRDKEGKCKDPPGSSSPPPTKTDSETPTSSYHSTNYDKLHNRSNPSYPLIQTQNDKKIVLGNQSTGFQPVSNRSGSPGSTINFLNRPQPLAVPASFQPIQLPFLPHTSICHQRHPAMMSFKPKIQNRHQFLSPSKFLFQAPFLQDQKNITPQFHAYSKEIKSPIDVAVNHNNDEDKNVDIKLGQSSSIDT